MVAGMSWDPLFARLYSGAPNRPVPGSEEKAHCADVTATS